MKWALRAGDVRRGDVLSVGGSRVQVDQVRPHAHTPKVDITYVGGHTVTYHEKSRLRLGSKGGRS